MKVTNFNKTIWGKISNLHSWKEIIFYWKKELCAECKKRIHGNLLLCIIYLISWRIYLKNILIFANCKSFQLWWDRIYWSKFLKSCALSKNAPPLKLTFTARIEDSTVLTVLRATREVLDPLIIFKGQNMQSTGRGVLSYCFL